MEGEVTICPQKPLSLYIYVIFPLCYYPLGLTQLPRPWECTILMYLVSLTVLNSFLLSRYPPLSKEAQAPVRALIL